MQLLIDSADLDAIRKSADSGMLDGVTTNPSLIANAGKPREEIIAAICDMVSGPVSAEVLATDYQEMLAEGRKLAQIAPNIVVKLPLGPDGLKACNTLAQENIKVNLTLCFSSVQALLAARAGAYFISPFIGRLDDIAQEGSELLTEIRHIYDNYHFKTKILAASIRSVNHVRLAALAGADAATIPVKVWNDMAKHPLTDKGLKAFLADAAK